MPIRILIVDDHRIVREGLRRILSSHSGFEVIAEASSGLQAIELSVRTQPDVVLMDIAMSDLNGIEATHEIVRQLPGTAVVVLSMFSEQSYISRALKAGARGYVLKASPEHELISAVEAVHAGESFLSAPVARIVVDKIRQSTDVQVVNDAYELLSPRERQVYQMLAEGKSNKEIANVLKISLHTVETHRVHLMEKLGVHSLAELVLSAVRRGLVS